ncbi:MAG: hypothetical protein LQ339_008655 [Xanthoria mediterranea]|nr:MAG: hypothetical protein LQ339_008655 [Xanthoria mediterranea]
MIDELIESCLPIFRDNSLDDDQRLEEVQRTLSAVSTLRGQQLESLTLRVAHLCRERIQEEETLKGASSPLRPASAPRIQVDRPSRQSSSSIELPADARILASPTGNMSSTSSTLNPNAQEFAPAPSLSPTQWPSPNAAVFKPSSPLSFQHRIPLQQEHAQEQRERYQSRLRSNNAGIKLIDDYLIPRERERVQQAQAEIAVLQAEYDELTREFFDNFPDNKGTWSLYEGEGSKRVRGWTVRKMQIDILKTFIKECPENVLRNLQETRERFFENLFPDEGEMGPTE